MRARILVAVALTFVGFSGSVTASGGRPVDIPTRIKGADLVVVASAGQISPAWRRNAFGDQLIVSEVVLQVEESLKGTAQPTTLMELEGGTIGGVTMRVSNLPDMRPGERAVLFLNRSTASPVFVPHLRGLGILKLDRDNHVQGSSLRLDDIRSMARGVAR